MRARTQARPVSRKKKNQEEPASLMKHGTKAFPAVNPVQQFKSGSAAQLYRIQAAHEVSDGLEMNSHSIRKDTEFSRTYQDSKKTFSSESGNFTGTRTDINTGNIAPILTSDLPSLKISENDEMAVANEGAQQREFFATQHLFDESNNELEAAAAKVRLGKGGGNIKLINNGPELYRVIPLAQPVPTGNWVKLETVGVTFCNRVTDKLIGATSRVAVLSKQLQQQMRQESEVPMKQMHGDPIWLREFLASPDNEKPQYDQLGPTYLNHFREDDIRLENALVDRGNMDKNLLDQEAQKYGINEYTLPEVGESYMTSSTPIAEYREHATKGIPRAEYFEVLQELQGLDQDLDIAEQDMSEKAKTLIDSWSYHFATVVGRDGADTMTLENYNRGVENENHIRDIFHKLFVGFEEYRGELQEHLEESQVEEGNIRYGQRHYHELIRWMGTELPVKRDNLTINAKHALQEALDSVEHGLNVDPEYQKRQLYFEMYGAGDQSFHTKFKPTGYHPNTLRVRESFALDKQRQVERTALLMPNITNHFKRYDWKTDVAQKFINTYLYGEISRYVRQKEQDLGNVNSKIQLDQWRVGCRQYTYPEILEVGTNIINNLVPFNVPVHPPTLEALSDAFDRVNELNTANTTFTLESTLRENFRDLGLSNYNIKDKKAKADLARLSNFTDVLVEHLRDIV